MATKRFAATLAQAAQAVVDAGALLTFPLANQKEPPSLWSAFYPRSVMRWEWDVGGDQRVADLWHLRTRLSVSGRVVYSKWFRSRATFFSKPLFTALLALNGRGTRKGLSPVAAQILDLLDDNSPQSTKEIKKLAGLRGRAFEGVYQRAMAELFGRGLIVGYGEVDDGAFPSLAVGATSLLFEDLHREAQSLSVDAALAIVNEKFPPGSLFRKHFEKLRAAGAAVDSRASRP